MAAGRYAGAEKLAALVAEVEASSDRLSTIKLSMLAGQILFDSGKDPAQAAYYFNKAQESLIAMSYATVAAARTICQHIVKSASVKRKAPRDQWATQVNIQDR